MSVFFLLLSVVTTFSTTIISIAVKLRRPSKKPCSDLIAEMRYVDMREICLACKARQQSGGDLLTAGELMLKLGGYEGLRRLHGNAGVMMDIARYLMLMDPGANALAQDIRRDAVRVRLLTMLLYLQGRLHLNVSGIAESATQLAKLYVTTSVNLMKLYGVVLDEVLPLIQEISNVQARMLRAREAGAF